MDRHRAAFEYEWRARFHLPLTVVGRSMTWGEALRLTTVLSSDPASRIAAALAEWAYPMTHEALVLADLFDVYLRVKSGKRSPKKYPRPWSAPRVRGRGTRLTVEQFEAIRASLREKGGEGV